MRYIEFSVAPFGENTIDEEVFNFTQDAPEGSPPPPSPEKITIVRKLIPMLMPISNEGIKNRDEYRPYLSPDELIKHPGRRQLSQLYKMYEKQPRDSGSKNAPTLPFGCVAFRKAVREVTKVYWHGQNKLSVSEEHHLDDYHRFIFVGAVFPASSLALIRPRDTTQEVVKLFRTFNGDSSWAFSDEEVMRHMKDYPVVLTLDNKVHTLRPGDAVANTSAGIVYEFKRAFPEPREDRTVFRPDWFPTTFWKGHVFEHALYLNGETKPPVLVQEWPESHRRGWPQGPYCGKISAAEKGQPPSP